MADDPNKETKVNTEEQQANTEQPTTQTNKEEAPKVQSAEEYIAAAPPGVREALESSMRTHQAAKDERIKTITAHEGNKFTEEYLKAQSLDVLDNMISLLPVSFRGQSGGTTQVRVEGGSDNDTVVAAPKVFETKPKSNDNQQAA